MTRYCLGVRSVLTGFFFSLFVSCALAQQGGRSLTDQALYLYVMQAAAQPSVQEELNLTVDQTAKMAEIRQSMSDPRKDAAENRKLLADAVKAVQGVLSVAQTNRLRQINLQTLHIQALLMPEAIEALEITGEQHKKLQDIESKRSDKLRILKKNSDTPLSELRTKELQLRKESMNEAVAVLTASQREKFEKMRGATFDFAKEVPPAPGYEGRKRN